MLLLVRRRGMEGACRDRIVRVWEGMEGTMVEAEWGYA